MQDKGEERGQVGEDAGQDDGVPCLVVNHAMQQLHALFNRQFLLGRRKTTERGFYFMWTRSLQKTVNELRKL